jgi:hypothetical protein
MLSSAPYALRYDTKSYSNDGPAVAKKTPIRSTVSSASSPSLPLSVTYHRRVELSDTTGKSSLSIQLGNVELGAGSNIRQLSFPVAADTSIASFMRTSPFLIDSGSVVSVDVSLHGKNWKCHGVMTIALVDTNGNSIDDLFHQVIAPAASVDSSEHLQISVVPASVSNGAFLQMNLDSVLPGEYKTNYVNVIVLHMGNVSSSNNQAASTPAQTLPARFSLSQNYPNPFNPTAVINYQLPEDGHVTLTVYDVLGREVKTLVDQDETAGYHQATLDGAQLASGIYFYRINITSSDGKNFVSVKKALLLK